jgi:hypothetical protein
MTDFDDETTTPALVRPVHGVHLLATDGPHRLSVGPLPAGMPFAIVTTGATTHVIISPEVATRAGGLVAGDEARWGYLRDYQTGEVIRPATEQELADSVEVELINGTGAITVAERKAFVQ